MPESLAAEFYMYVGDTSPPLRFQFEVDGAPVDLTGASVRLQLRFEGRTDVWLDQLAAADAGQATTPTDPSAGRGWAQYNWQVGDTVASGVVVARGVATLPGGAIQSTPPFRFPIIDKTIDTDNLTNPYQALDRVAEYQPSIGEVATLMLTRTVDNNGVQLGVFTANTRPSDAQAEQLINVAVTEVAGFLGPAIPLPLVPWARFLVSLRAAMLIELAYYSEQVASDHSSYNSWDALYTSGAKNLAAAIERLTGEDVSAEQLIPGYFFPPAPFQAVGWRPSAIGGPPSAWQNPPYLDPTTDWPRDW